MSTAGTMDHDSSNGADYGNAMEINGLVSPNAGNNNNEAKRVKLDKQERMLEKNVFWGVMLNTQVGLKWHNCVTEIISLTIMNLAHPKLELSRSFCSTNRPLGVVS
jgi:hypothetical protein